MSIPFRLRQLDHVVLRVRDVAGMRRFYCDVLGCTPELAMNDRIIAFGSFHVVAPVLRAYNSGHAPNPRSS